MPKFFNQDLAQLAHQLTLSPRRLRPAQLAGIEKVLAMVEPDRAYPYDLVCYLITDYRKRGAPAGALIPGKALIGDMATMSEVLSRRANLTTAELGEPYCTHQEVAEELRVSTKTVRRWRGRGLTGLRVVFPDGVNRLAFRRSTIDRFVLRNRALVEKGASFKQLSAAERDAIVSRAREIVGAQRLKLHAVAKLIAAETGRAVETVRYTLRRYDESNAATALFTGKHGGVLGAREQAIWTCHEAGDSPAAIANAIGCAVSEVEQALRSVPIRRRQEAPPEFVYHALFDAPNADTLILDIPEPTAPREEGLVRVPKDLPPYLRSLYLTPLLTREQEQDLFRRYNYLKFKAARLLTSLDADIVTAEQCAALDDLLAKADDLRQRITRANLRLVVSIAKRHVGGAANFFEVVSDGNMSLMRAVEKFDFSFGNKFSTYASWAIMKNYARSIPETHYHAARYVTGQDELLDAAADRHAPAASDSDRRAVRNLLEAGLKELPEREREIVCAHFGLGAASGHTLEELGKRFGVTKERIRQIEQRALARLREVLTPTLAETLGE